MRWVAHLHHVSSAMKPDSLVARLLPPALLLAVSVVLLFGILHASPVWTLDIGTPGDTRFLSGVFPTEYDGAVAFRWSRPDTQITLHGASDGLINLRLHLHGDRRAEEGNQGMWLERGGETIAAFDIAAGWRVYDVLLPAGAALTTWNESCQRIDCVVPSAVPIALHSTNYQPVSGDTRELGVSLDQVEVAPLTAGSPITTLLRTLLLGWALTVLTGVLWRLDMLLATQATASNQRTGLLCVRSVRVSLLAGIAALALLAWAYANPYTLAWAAQPLPWMLTLATALLIFSFVPRAPPSVALRFPLSVPRSSLLTFRTLCVALLVVAHLVLLLPLPVAWRGTAAHILLALPGVLLAVRLFGDERDLPDDAAAGAVVLFLALCGALMVSPLIMLVLQALPGALPWWLPLLVCDAVSVALLIQNRGQTLQWSSFFVHRSPLRLLVPVLLLGAALRLPLLGSAEFQGDEGNVILMATGILHGHDDVLMLHRKGPLEVLLVAGPLVVTGHINELVARLPFALSGIGVLLGVFLLGQRIVQHSVWPGLLAATILALDGFLIAFSRIVQYQSVVLVMSIGALWCCWRFSEGAVRYHRYLVAAALMVATGLLAHYDTIFVVPLLVWLVLLGGRRRAWSLTQWARAVTAPLLLTAALLTSFFLPFITHERFARTTDYLAQRLAESEQSGIFFNNLLRYYPLATYYNTTFQMAAATIALLTALLAWLCLYMRPRPAGWLLAALLMLGSAVMLWSPHHLVVAVSGLDEQMNWSIIAFGLPLTALILAPTTPRHLRVFLLWFTPPFIAMTCIIARPNTHFYTISIAGALLIGLALTQLVAWLRRPQRVCAAPLLLSPLLLGGIFLLLVSVPYLFIVYVRQVPEYRRTFPDARPGLYLASYGDTLPEDGSYFGFTHRDGWKVIGELYRQRVLHGDYDSNQKSLVTGWYTRGAFRCSLDPAYYFAARFEPYRFIPNHYHLAGYVTVDGVRTLDIYTRERPQEPLMVFALEEYRQAFDATAVPHFPMQRALAETLPQYRRETAWQGGIRLLGYDLEHQELPDGQAAMLLLSWQYAQHNAGAEEHEMELDDYEVVVWLLDSSGTPVLEAAPVCDRLALSEWHTRESVQTAFTIPNTPHIPPGSYSVHVGLRNRRNGAMLPIPGSRETREKIVTLVLR